MRGIGEKLGSELGNFQKEIRRMENELEVVNIRLVKELSLYSEQTLDNPQAVVELMAKELSQYDREVFCIHHAQLIFNTHNPIFLNSNLFRRDEIKFVERDDDTHDSVLYALSDFGTTSDKGVRKHEDYMSKYFISQYGAIKDIDFTPIFEEILCDEKEG